MRPRTLLLFAFVALAGAATAVPALATAPEVTLNVNQNCVQLNWPCWTAETSVMYPHPDSRVTIKEGREIEFVEHDPSTAAGVNWIGGGTPPPCTGVQTTAQLNWNGTCKFEQPGIYNFESPTMFMDAYNNYRKYEIVVAGMPTDATTKASGETQTEAMLNGSIKPEGNTVQYHFEYEGPGVTGGKQSTPAATLSAADFTSDPVSAQVTGLEPGMIYHFQLVATYGAGNTSVSGATKLEFTTHTVAAPTATTLAAEGLKETEATLKGTVNLGGEATEYFFEYGTDTNYGQKTTKATLQTSGGSDQGVSAALKGLTPGTEYHFRLVAENKHGSEKGGDSSFKTLPTPVKEPTKEPPAKEPTPTPTPTPTPGPISPEPEPAPLGSALVGGSLKLTAPRHGSSVSGSLVVSKSGAGGRLEIDLIASSASLAKVRHKQSTSTAVGRLVRSSVSAGNVSFSISLNARAKGALRRHHKLALTVKITLTPPTGAPAVATRNVVLHA